MISLIFVWFTIAAIVGIAANTRGRFGFGWFAVSLVVSPLLAGLLLFALPRLATDEDGGGAVYIEGRRPWPKPTAGLIVLIAVAVAIVVMGVSPKRSQRADSAVEAPLVMVPQGSR